MSKIITIIDHQVSNLLSVKRAVQSLGFEAVATSDPDAIANAEHLILPGVGAFEPAMQRLHELDLVAAIKHCVLQNQRPMLGICLGMQILFDHSYEFGGTDGLGLISGIVVEIPRVDTAGNKLKVPHVGWNHLQVPNHSGNCVSPLFNNIADNEAVYFVHSYMAKVELPAEIAAVTEYGGNTIVAAVQKNNIFGCQFHPEKSGAAGLRILNNFLSL